MWDADTVSYVAGFPPRQEKSFWPPMLQLALALGLLVGGRWADVTAQSARATDAWVFTACLYLLGVLYLPFALVVLGRVTRNRIRGIEVVRR